MYILFAYHGISKHEVLKSLSDSLCTFQYERNRMRFSGEWDVSSSQIIYGELHDHAFVHTCIICSDHDCTEAYSCKDQ